LFSEVAPMKKILFLLILSLCSNYCYAISSADLNKDGIVNFEDLAIFASQWLVVDYNGVQPHRQRPQATFVVAACNSSVADKYYADYICTGINDQLMIQNAIDACPANGGSVYLTDGTYNINAPILLNGTSMNKQSIVFEGAGYDTVIKMIGEIVVDLAQNTTAGDTAINVTDASSYVVGMSIGIADIDPNKDGGRSQYWEAAKIIGIQGNSILLNRGLHNRYVVGMSKVYNSSDMIQCLADMTFTLRNMTLDGNFDSYSYLAYTRGAPSLNNEMPDKYRSNLTVRRSHDAEIYGCWFKNPAFNAILLLGYLTSNEVARTKIHDNLFDIIAFGTWNRGVCLETGTEYSIVSNNTFRNTAPAPKFSYPITAVYAGSNGTGSFTIAGLHAAEFVGTDQITINPYPNAADRFTVTGTSVNNGDFKLKAAYENNGNTILMVNEPVTKTTGQGGILAQATMGAEVIYCLRDNLTVTGNTIIGQGHGSGISAVEFDYISITDNVVENFNVGIYAKSSSSYDIIGANSVNVCRTGIMLSPYCDNITVQGNIITNVNANNQGNNISNFYGIYVRGSNNSIVSGNQVSSPVANGAYAGIYLSSSNNCTVSDNNVVGFTNCGIMLNRSSSNTVAQNTIDKSEPSSSAICGIYLANPIPYCTDNKIDGNTIIGNPVANLEMGIYSASGNSGNEFPNNSFFNVQTPIVGN